MEHNHLRSHMSVVQGLGSAKHGVKHWCLQRLTALAMIPLSVWFVFSLMRAMLFPEPEMVTNWLGSPFSAVALVLFLVAMFVHAALGIQAVVEDYVKCPWKKYMLLIGNQFACTAFALIGILSIIRLHFLDVLGGL
jgi:succinate dehydrogenase / fumarate reductase, membrane anchor subunit